jgi:hypothetical protein
MIKRSHSPTDDEQVDIPVFIRALARIGRTICSGAIDGSITALRADRSPSPPLPTGALRRRPARERVH